MSAPKLIAFNGDPALKATLLDFVDQRAADALIHLDYGVASPIASFRAVAPVGCTLNLLRGAPAYKEVVCD